MTTKVTVLTPTLNSEKFIGQCLKSVADLNTPEILVNHIIIDGGSSDGTSTICKSLDGRYRVKFISEPGTTQSEALNLGLCNVTPETQWIGWLNADERYEPDAFKKILHFLPVNEHACVLYGDFNRISETGAIIKKNQQWNYDHEIGKLLTPIIQNCAALFNRDCIPEPFINNEYDFIMDWDFYIRLLRCPNSRAIYVPVTIGNYMMQPQSKTARNREKFTSEIKIFNKENYPGKSPFALYWYRKFLVIKFFLILIREGKFLYKLRFKVVTQRKYKNLFGS